MTPYDDECEWDDEAPRSGCGCVAVVVIAAVIQAALWAYYFGWIG